MLEEMWIQCALSTDVVAAAASVFAEF